MRPHWIKIALLLALVWGMIGGAIWIVRKNRATPERIAEFVGANTLDGKAPADRAKLIEEVAKRVNSLEYEQRQEMHKHRMLAPLLASMNADEKAGYFALVLPKGFKQMNENLNKMERGKRQRVIEKATRELQERGGDLLPGLDAALAKQVIEHGLKSFYSDASIETKMDALPFIEALEQTVKWSH